MANTAVSNIHTDVVVYGNPIIKWGTLAANTYKPGDWVYESAANTWTVVDGDTAATKVVKPCLIAYPPRLNLSTKARRDVDDDFQDQTTARVPIITGNKGPGPLIVVGKIEDPGGAIRRMQRFNVGTTTAGVLEVANTTDLGGGYAEAPVSNVDALANGDTYAKFQWD